MGIETANEQQNQHDAVCSVTWSEKWRCYLWTPGKAKNEEDVKGGI